ncbi:E3 ubiquitin-protein ligase RAD18 isoform X1 [Cyprinodon tularosa]|uniref:E3 ubiquitin-protein ligase RAD18 isoform X1 n=1 Tax=Cyprinodon tularosa TaxID=77115 RepID=UPI0018E273B7|nr:E3 ubiquitin-protein ligase RAD18 isoform X1 [Cyprinodon tularosa]
MFLTVKEIAREVEANEKMRNQMERKTRPVMVFSKNQSEKEIDEMHLTYRKQHSSDFSRLIAQVRGRMQTRHQTCAKQEGKVEKEEAQASQSSVHGAEANHAVEVKVENVEDDEDSPATVLGLPCSPSVSDVSISSSISDIFGPESSLNIEDVVKSPVQKRPSSSRGSNAEKSPGTAKRRRKT